MATIPTGNPAWTRTSGITSYGGDANKVNYQGVPIVNPKTDVGAEHLLRIAADMSAVAKMADFAVLSITMGSGSDTPTVNECRMMTGIYTGSGYSGTSPPTGFPTVTGVSNGIVQVAFSASYSDPYAVSGTFTPTFARPSVANAAPTAGARAFATVSGSNVTVKVETASGSGIVNETVNVWVA